MVDALIAGHVCLDIIPALRAGVVLEPGRLVEAGPVKLSTGGAVSNTGLALDRLGVETRLLGKIAEDPFGRSIEEIFEGFRPGLGGSMRKTAGESTSYTVVISVPGQDRTFLHSPGCNDEFVSADVSDEMLANCRLFHFGYPPLMAKMFANGGRELVDLFRRAKAQGATTSLDMSLPDRDSESGRIDWVPIYEKLLPYVDLFLPSVEELLFTMDRAAYDRLQGADLGRLPEAYIERLAERALAMGTRMMGIKVGSQGFFLEASKDLSHLGRARAEGWEGQSWWHPCFKVKVAGTTGAGDATIAGFLMGVLKGFSPFDACRAAVAVGACCCEGADAIGGVRDWPETQARIDDDWDVLSVHLPAGWVGDRTGFRKI